MSLSPESPVKISIADRRRRLSAYLVSSILSLVLAVQTCALPIPLAFLLISADAKSVTEGCEKETCCTALCYLDKDGVHHCVHLQNEHKHGDSCKCEISTDDVDVNLILHYTPGTLPELEQPPSFLIPDGWISQRPVLAESHNPATPSPPPK
jgi:hypothetical protein